MVSAAATNQSRSVAAAASLPSSSASLASTALLISSRSPFSAGAIAGGIEKSPPSVWFAFAAGDLRAKLGLSMTHTSYAGIGVEELVVRLRSAAISEERFVAEMASLLDAFERIVGGLTLAVNRSSRGEMASSKYSGW